MSAVAAMLMLSACNPCGVVRIGDYGRGTPTTYEVATCQVVSHGEMIYDPRTNLWTCES